MIKINSNLANRLLFNWQYKAMSVIFAISVYLVVSAVMVDDRVVSIPLEVKLPANLEARSNVPDSIEVVISGDNDILYVIDPNRIKASLDFSAVTTPGIAISPVLLDTSELMLTNKGVSCMARPSQCRVLFGER